MADHALMLLQSIQSVLDAQVPLAGGWLATRLETPTYPFGTIDLTSSTPGRGQTHFTQNHTGIVSVWSRKRVNEVASPTEAFHLSEAAMLALNAADLITTEIRVRKFNCGSLIPANPDGITWGRRFTFTASTEEA